MNGLSLKKYCNGYFSICIKNYLLSQLFLFCMDELTRYSEISSFVQKYGVSKGGLDESLPGSNVVDSVEAVVILDAFLRRHYKPLSISDLVEITEVDTTLIEAIVEDFQSVNFIELTDEGYELNTENSSVKELRDLQKSLF